MACFIATYNQRAINRKVNKAFKCVAHLILQNEQVHVINAQQVYQDLRTFFRAPFGSKRAKTVTIQYRID